MKVLKVLIKIICIILVAAAVSTAVFFRPNQAIRLNAGKETSNTDSISLDYSAGNFKKIAASGFTELYFNETTAAISVKETSLKKVWYSSLKNTDSDIILKIRDNEGEHILTSSQSVSAENFKTQYIENGVSVEYTMSSAQGKNDSPAFTVKTDYVLTDGNLFVNAEVSKDGQDAAAVESLQILPFFGAFENPDKDDYLVLPDGCGAIACPFYAELPEDYAVRVYSQDLAYETKNGAAACFGAFGLKNKDSAFAAIINIGEEYATIRAHSDKNGQSSVYADFCFDAVYQKDGKAYYTENTEKSAEICYKFLSSENASYTEIASSCREQFIRSGLLPTVSAESTDTLPMFLTINGAYKSNVNIPGYEKLTTFAQALDILKRVKSKGIDNINVRFKNVFAPDSARTASALGSKKDLKELAEYASSLNVPLYFDADILFFLSHFGPYSLYGAKQADKMTYSFITDLAVDGMTEYKFKYRFRTAEGTGRFVSGLIDKTKDFGISGFCLNDAGRFLCSDFAGRSANRTQAKENIVSQLPAMQNLGGMIVENGNIYTVKNSSAVINIPMSAYYDQSESYRRIPFVQTVYHGITVLAGEPINAKQDIHTETLRCIEYGVCPDFSAVFTGTDNEPILFKNASDVIIKEYGFMQDAVSGLEGERITEHSAVKDNVYCTTFSDGTMIYVNYNSQKTVINGLTVQGNSYLRIK